MDLKKKSRKCGTTANKPKLSRKPQHRQSRIKQNKKGGKKGAGERETALEGTVAEKNLKFGTRQNLTNSWS